MTTDTDCTKAHPEALSMSMYATREDYEAAMSSEQIQPSEAQRNCTKRLIFMPDGSAECPSCGWRIEPTLQRHGKAPRPTLEQRVAALESRAEVEALAKEPT